MYETSKEKAARQRDMKNLNGDISCSLMIWNHFPKLLIIKLIYTFKAIPIKTLAVLSLNLTN